MIQAIREGQSNKAIEVYMALYDTYNVEVGAPTFFKPLFGITSHQTNQTKFFIPYALDTTYKERYFKMTFSVVTSSGLDIPVAGLIHLGTEDYPYGLYDCTIYRNSAEFNLNPAPTGQPLTIVSKGLFNLKTDPEGTNEAVTYTEYESTQEQEVYITNEYI